ncbi:ATP-dependent DNA helicase UvrD2 [Stomatohabitans albus]|uniref:ATP-dependent helicase n=1 Tax=Stomatohabitans albus TaxID=3110766 RepID=UPI00300C9260
MEYLEGLNAEQRRAVETLRGPVRILAGAGTGKTRTITHRIAHQIHTGTFAPSEVMAVTFTDRAAGELRDRLATLGVPTSIRAATVHAAAWAQVRYFWGHLSDRPIPEVIPNPFRVVGPIARRLDVEAADLINEMNWAANANLTPEQVATSGRDELVSPTDLADAITDYTEAKRLNDWIDYHDMLRLAIRLGDTSAITTIRERYRAFTIDEFQDTNALQWALLRLWDGGRGEMCVVGDPCQSIFGFTGANASYLTGFTDHYPEAATVALRESYRSTNEIVAFTNQILPNEANLIAQAPCHGPEPKVYTYTTAANEQAGTIKKIQQLLDHGLPASDIAILVRLNVQTADWEQALWEAGIPVVIPGEGSFYARREVVAVIQALITAYHQVQEQEANRPPLVGTPPPPTVEGMIAELDVLIKRGLRWSPTAPIPVGAKARETWQVIATIRNQCINLIKAGHSLAETIGEVDARRARQGHVQEAAVTLMTLHKSKGTEFRVVIIPACERGFLPVTQAKTPEEQAEEQRLFYVGCTRAKQLLLLSYAQLRVHPVSGKAQKRKPSPFIPGVETAARKASRAKPGRELPETAVVQALRTWRLARAKSDGVPAFVVLGNTALLAIAETMPATPQELEAVYGMGPKKVVLYGDDILHVLRTATQDRGEA